MRKFTVNCDFGGQLAPFAIYVGRPAKDHHPLQFQADWLSKQRGGTIPAEVMDAISQLQKLAEKNGVPLEDLCVYALGTEEEKQATSSDIDIENEESDSEPDASDMISEGGPVNDDEE